VLKLERDKLEQLVMVMKASQAEALSTPSVCLLHTLLCFVEYAVITSLESVRKFDGCAGNVRELTKS